MNELERDAAREADVVAKLRVIRAQLWTEVYNKTLMENPFADMACERANYTVDEFDKTMGLNPTNQEKDDENKS